MYLILFGSNFLVSAKRLDKKIRSRLKKNLDILRENPFHSTLHTKPLRGDLANFYSFRVGRNYRVIFQFSEGKKIILLTIKPRDKVYK